MKDKERINEPIFIKILLDFGICFECVHTAWKGCCTTCASTEIIIFEIMLMDKIW